MKIAFSTLGCPDFDWPDIYSMAKDLGFDGIEIRGLGKDIFAVRARPFTEEELPNTIKKLKELRLEIPCLSSGCCLKFAEKAEQNHNEIVQYIELAHKLGTPYVRVLADLEPQPGGEVDDEAVLAALRRLIPIAEGKGVTLLIETNGVYTDTKRLSELLANAASDAVGALWDVHHPYRFTGETADTTVKNLGAYIKYVHVKDSVMQDGKVSYMMMGEGDLPFNEFMMALRSVNYDGYISLEWVKRWASDLSDAGVVFPHFVNFMSAYVRKGTVRGRLHSNNAGTGQYIWEKDALIDLTFRRCSTMLWKSSLTSTLSVTRRMTTPGHTGSSGMTWTRSPGHSSPWESSLAIMWPSGRQMCPSGSSRSGQLPRSGRCL